MIAAVAIAVAAVTPVAKARNGFATHMSAWNRGDLKAALAIYWNDPGITWVSRRGLERGFQSFADAMRADFADRTEIGVYTGEILLRPYDRPRQRDNRLEMRNHPRRQTADGRRFDPALEADGGLLENRPRTRGLRHLT